MPIPDELDGWTYGVVDELASLGRNESDRHDFKFRLPDPESLTKLCCAFANGAGGFVVVGVGERHGGWSVEGVEPNREIAAQFNDRLRATPSIPWPPPRQLDVPDSARVLCVFHVPRSARRPHIPFDPDRRAFWKRVPGGCERMTLEEVRAQIMDHEGRRQQLTLLAIELGEIRDILLAARQVPRDELPQDIPPTAMLERLLVDAYPVIEGDAELVQALVGLRWPLRTLRTEWESVGARIATGLAVRPELLLGFWQRLDRKVELVVPLIDFALWALDHRLGIRNPFPQGVPPDREVPAHPGRG